jgi:hypothetical protein
MAQYEMTMFWTAVACYGIAAFCYIFGLLARKEALFNCALSFVVSVSAGILVRSHCAGSPAECRRSLQFRNLLLPVY